MRHPGNEVDPDRRGQASSKGTIWVAVYRLPLGRRVTPIYKLYGCVPLYVWFKRFLVSVVHVDFVLAGV